MIAFIKIDIHFGFMKIGMDVESDQPKTIVWIILAIILKSVNAIHDRINNLKTTD